MSQHLPFILENITNPELNFDNFFIGIAESLVQDQIDIKDRLKALDATSKTTKIELFKRVSESREFIEDNYSQKINLEELASNACLSKYHFLRSFKAIYKQSPYQYLLGLKLQKAKELLPQELEVTDKYFYLSMISMFYVMCSLNLLLPKHILSQMLQKCSRFHQILFAVGKNKAKLSHIGQLVGTEDSQSRLLRRLKKQNTSP